MMWKGAALTLALLGALHVHVASAASLSGDEHADNQEHDHASVARHGGIVADLGPDGHAELVARDNRIRVFLTDSNGGAVESEGGGGRLTLLRGTVRMGQLPLVPAGGNQLAAVLPGGYGGTTRIVANIRFAGMWRLAGFDLTDVDASTKPGR